MPSPPVDPTAGYLFLSYSRADQDYVRRLAADLRDHGFAVWFDDQIDLGERWWPTQQCIEQTEPPRDPRFLAGCDRILPLGRGAVADRGRMGEGDTVPC